MTQIKTILSFFRKIASNLLDGMIKAREQQVQAYLAGSVDIADLERRMKEVQKGAVGRSFY